jgi:glycosyltransferase involved in cell wall biosynthesis
MTAADPAARHGAPPSGAFPVSRFPVLLVAAPAAFGGVERVVAALAIGLHRRGWPVHVLVFLDVGSEANDLVARLETGGVPVHPLEVPHRAYGFERRQLRRMAERTGARVVHTHGTRVDVVDSPAASRLGLATVTTLHGFTGGGARNRLYEWLQVRAVRRCDAVVAVSRPMAARLRRSGVPDRRLHVIPNAWWPRSEFLGRERAREELGVPRDGWRIGWVGRPGRVKGSDVLLDALLLLQDPPLEASIIGESGERAGLEQRARVAGLDRRVRWHGTVPDADRCLPAFDVFVLSSRTEGTPIVLLEAIAAGVPVVATAVGGIPDVVGPEEALLVPPDDPRALARAIRAVRDDPAGAAARAARARARLAREFAVEPWLDAYERIYRGVVAAGTGSAASGEGVSR